MVGGDEVVALGFGDAVAVKLPLFGEEVGCTVLVEKLKLGLAQCEDTTEDQGADAVRVGLSIGERERRAPRATKDVPLGDAVLLAKCFNVGDEMPGSVVNQVSVRGALACTTLVERENTVVRRVEPSSFLGPDSSTRSAVKADDGVAVLVTAPFVVDGVTIVHFEFTGFEGFDGRVWLAQ